MIMTSNAQESHIKFELKSAYYLVIWLIYNILLYTFQCFVDSYLFLVLDSSNNDFRKFYFMHRFV